MPRRLDANKASAVCHLKRKSGHALDTRQIVLQSAASLDVRRAGECGGPIVVANLSHAERPADPAWPPPDASYGWPLIWYRCEFKSIPHAPRGVVSGNMKPQLVQWSGVRLAGNVVMWLIVLIAAGLACEWSLRRFGSAARSRQRVLTTLALMLVAAIIVLANLSTDDAPLGLWVTRPSYGWPLIWRWRDVQPWYGATTELDENYSPFRLMLNLAIWLVILGATGAACEWLLRRHRPRFRWSLRVMLAAVAAVGAGCAGCVALIERARVQDQVLAVAEANGNFEVYLERWGPKWLDIVGADRFRRRIVGAVIPGYSDVEDEAFLKSLQRLSTLRYLNLEVLGSTPGMADALADMSQLRTLRIDAVGYGVGEIISPECIAAIGKLSQLEELYLEGMTDSGSLDRLAGLTNLRLLSLGFNWDYEGEPGESDSDDWVPILASLPALPRLESLDLRSTFGDPPIRDDDLPYLAIQPRLKSLNVSDCNITAAGLGELQSLKSLQELAIDGELATPAGLQSLLALKHLTALHVQRYGAVTDDIVAALPAQESLELRENAGGAMYDWERNLVWALKRLREMHTDETGSYDKSDRLTTVELDHGKRILALQCEVAGLRRALDALRHAHPGIVIDSDPKWFDQYRGEKSPGTALFPWTP